MAILEIILTNLFFVFSFLSVISLMRRKSDLDLFHSILMTLSILYFAFFKYDNIDYQVGILLIFSSFFFSSFPFHSGFLSIFYGVLFIGFTQWVLLTGFSILIASLFILPKERKLDLTQMFYNPIKIFIFTIIAPILLFLEVDLYGLL